MFLEGLVLQDITIAGHWINGTWISVLFPTNVSTTISHGRGVADKEQL